MISADLGVAAAALPQSQQQMYQFQPVAADRGQAAGDQARFDSQFMMADREVGRDLKLSNANGPRVGDGLLRDFSRFSGMMQSLEPKRDIRSASLRAPRGDGRTGDRRMGDGAAAMAPNPASQSPGVDKAIADYRRAAEYAAYLSAMAVAVQSGVSGLKRLQQG
jgi:hypothetical protein